MVKCVRFFDYLQILRLILETMDQSFSWNDDFQCDWNNDDDDIPPIDYDMPLANDVSINLNLAQK